MVFQTKIKFFQDMETGKVLEATEVIRPLSNRSKFEIIYLDLLCNLLEKIGGKKLKVLTYILEHKDTNNIVLGTVREIAKKINVSHTTVQDTLTILEKENIIIKKYDGVLMINPKMLNCKSSTGEFVLIQKFQELKK